MHLKILHIVLVNRWYPPLSNGGIAVYNFYLARALVKLGHHVTVIAARWSAEKPAYSVDEGVKIHRLLMHHYTGVHRLPIMGRYMRGLQQMQYSFQVAHKLYELEQADRPDVIEFAEVNAEGWAYLRQKKHVPVIVRCHTPTFVLREYYDTVEMPFDTKLTTRLEKNCIHQANVLSAPSCDMAQTIAQHIDRINVRDFCVIPNTLDTTQFAVDDRSYARQPITVLHVGRLDRAKGIETLARAIPQVVERYPDVNFVYVGGDRPDGEGSTWQKRLNSYFEQQQVQRNIVFTGNIDHNELLAWYKRADIAVVPSMLYESFSYTVAQAMAAGLPVIASRIGGIPETLQNGQYGLLTAVGDVNNLVEELCKLIEQQSLRQTLGTAASQYARQEFAPEVVAQQTLDLYRSIL